MVTTTVHSTMQSLPQAERMRLIRSTRKLGALLGETLLLAETQPTIAVTLSHARSASPTSSVSKRHGRLFKTSLAVARSSSRGSSPAAPVSPAMTGRRRGPSASRVSRPVLFVRVPAPGDAAAPAEHTPLPSPLSSTFSLALNSPGAPAADGSRRRKMAKLARTLGENVPPELVFAAASMRRRRASTLSIHERQPMRKYSTASRIAEALPSIPSSGHEDRASSDTSTSAGSSASSGGSGEPLLPPPSNAMHRKQQGWSGEWRGNVGNMGAVVRSLRGFKLK
ncbi:hypothetical protein FB451DRAFT_1182505 [Mycena latifolia]|nr:hypothetical protein FB451DRAFT_1182505 [Mycena latifolia]